MNNQPSPNYLRGLAKVTVAVLLVAAAALVLIDRSEDRAQPVGRAQPVVLTEAEQAFAVASAEILDVDPASTDHRAAVAGGYNACDLIGEFGLDPVTLDGWDEHWHQPWELEWLEAAVRFLCPPGGAR